MKGGAIGLAVLVVGATACGESPPLAMSPSLDRSPTSRDSSEEACRAAVEQTARGDLRCAQVATVMKFDRRYANSSVVRYVVEGCGTRATYAETCEDYPKCRYLLLSTLSISGAAAVSAAPSR